MILRQYNFEYIYIYIYIYINNKTLVSSKYFNHFKNRQRYNSDIKCFVTGVGFNLRGKCD